MSVIVTPPRLEALRQAGAPGFDAVAWHYIEVLAERLDAQTGAAQALLQRKLDQAMQSLQDRMSAAAQSTTRADALRPVQRQVQRQASPLAHLLRDLAARHATAQPTGRGALGRAENPRVQQFRKTLSKISVQKQVTQAIAQAPHNAGPINSHMLVLRSLSRMRELSPDYLNRFMAHVDTLLRLNEVGQAKPSSKKSATSAKAKK